jgi:hypothetical protein
LAARRQELGPYPYPYAGTLVKSPVFAYHSPYQGAYMSSKKKHHVLRTILFIIGGIFVGLVLIAIFAPEPPPKSKEPEEVIAVAEAPRYEPIDPSRTDIDTSKPYANVASIEESHIGNTKRYTYNVVIYQRVNKEILELIARNVYEQAKTETPFNALSIGFYDYPQFIGSGNRFGYVEFAPNGIWGEATTIKTGDYTKMKMSNHLREPKWEYALTANDAEIISVFYETANRLSENANTGQEVEDAENAAMNYTAQRYGITNEELDGIFSKYNTAYFGN